MPKKPPTKQVSTRIPGSVWLEFLETIHRLNRQNNWRLTITSELTRLIKRYVLDNRK